MKLRFWVCKKCIKNSFKFFSVHRYFSKKYKNLILHDKMDDIYDVCIYVYKDNENLAAKETFEIIKELGCCQIP